METSTAEPAAAPTDQGHQEEPQEVQRPVQRQGQSAPEQGQQGVGKKKKKFKFLQFNSRTIESMNRFGS